MNAESVVITAERAGYGVFAAALRASEYVEILDAGGPFTVFAPSDAAFDKFSRASLDSLLHGDTERLRKVVGYHFAAGKVMAQRFKGKRIRAVMYAGGDLIIDGQSGLRAGRANVTQPDILAGACVLHGIDGVLWPREPAARGQ